MTPSSSTRGFGLLISEEEDAGPREPARALGGAAVHLRSVASVVGAVVSIAIVVAVFAVGGPSTAKFLTRRHADGGELVLAASASATEASVVKGYDKENSCPTGYERITDEATCRAAMPFLEGGDPDHYNGAANEADWPKGCYVCKGASGCENGVWFNPHETGRQRNKAKPICQKGFSIKTGATVFVGDSDIDYWHSFRTGVAESYNVGIGGNTCNDVKKEIDFILNSFKPKTLVLVCGENDLAAGASVTTTYKRWLWVVGKIRASGARVIQIGTKPEPSTTDLHSKYRTYDAKIRKYVVSSAADDELPPMVFVDSYKAFVERGNPDSVYDSDELHLSSQGYDRWNEWLKLGVSNLFACVVWSGDKCEVQAPTVNLMKSSANECPEGYEKITTLAECRAAVGLAKIPGNTFVGSETESAFPAGCYYCKGIDSCTEGTWFNEDATGQVVKGARLYCKLKL